MNNRIKSRHGHYANIFEEEAKRLKQMYKEIENIDITWVEATALAAERSFEVTWVSKKAREKLAKLRGL